MAASGSIGNGDFLAIRAAARRLPCRDRVLYDAVKSGDLAGYRLGSRTVRVFWPEVITWVRSKRVKATPHAAARLREVLERESRAPGTP